MGYRLSQQRPLNSGGGVTGLVVVVAVARIGMRCVVVLAQVVVAAAVVEWMRQGQRVAMGREGRSDDHVCRSRHLGAERTQQNRCCMERKQTLRYPTRATVEQRQMVMM